MQSKFMKTGRWSPRALRVPLLLILSSFALCPAASAVNVALLDGANVASPSKLALLPPDPLLSVDLNRNEIVNKLVARWRAEATDSQLDSLKARLAGLRADRLLAVSLVGSFDGVLKVLYGQEKADQVTVARRDGQKALGDANVDLVYTPLTPCRLFDTRTGQISTLGTVGGIFNPNTRRTISPAGNCGVPASGIRSLVMGLTTRNSTPGSGGYIAVVAPAAGISATVDIFNLGSEWSATNIIAPTSDSGQFDVFVSTATADVVMDIVGYFAAPPQPIGDITEVNTGTATSTGLTGGVTSGIAALSLTPGFKLPQGCTTSQIPSYNSGTGLWGCTNATSSGGTVTNIATGAGLTGGPISTTGTVSIAAGGVSSALLAPNLTLGGTTTGTFSGPLTGNVTGNVSGNAASFSSALAGDVTGTQGTTFVPSTTVTGKTLTGFVSGAGTISAFDSILTAINKLDGNIALKAPLASPLVVNPFASTVIAVDSAGTVGQFSSITLGADGLPVISYRNSSIGTLKVAKCINATCSGASTVTTVDSAGDVGYSTSITLGADGLPVISYFDFSNGDLKVAKCINAACTGASTITTVDNTGSVGEYTSITLGADGLPVISYYDTTNTALKVAKCINAACTGASIVTTVDSAGTVGLFTSITLGADGLPVISYYENTNSDLKVAKCINAACTGASILTTVDSAGTVGLFTSITLGADGLPMISYYDFSNDNLKVAKCINAACTGASILTTVDSAGNVGQYTSITLGADGLPVISYLDVTNNDLKVAKCINAACTGASTLTTVDSAGVVGEYSSITLGADGLPVISYYDNTNGDLKVVKCTSATCVPFVRRR